MTRVNSLAGRIVPSEEVARAKLWVALAALAEKLTELIDVVVEQERSE